MNYQRKNWYKFLSILGLCALLAFGTLSCRSKNSALQPELPLQVILDTDLGNDIDDLLALQMLINYERCGKVKIVGISVSKANPLAMAFTKSYYAKYGIGSPDYGYVFQGVNPDEGNYLAKAYDSLAGNRPAPEITDAEAYKMLRRQLAQSADTSIHIIAIGPMTNIARLLESSPDEYSSLTGMELVKQKVRRLDFMGGNFNVQSPAEWNILQDSVASRKVIETWPTLMVASGFEVGDKVRYPASSAVGDFDAAHPLRVGYENFIPMPYDRPCWDLIPIINLVEHNPRLLHESDNGRIRLDEKCCTRFDIDHSGNCRFVALNTDTLTSFIAGKVKPMKQSENINNK